MTQWLSMSSNQSEHNLSSKASSLSQGSPAVKMFIPYFVFLGGGFFSNVPNHSLRAQPRPQGAFPWLWGRGGKNPGKSALGTRLAQGGLGRVTGLARACKLHTPPTFPILFGNFQKLRKWQPPSFATTWYTSLLVHCSFLILSVSDWVN